MTGAPWDGRTWRDADWNGRTWRDDGWNGTHLARRRVERPHLAQRRLERSDVAGQRLDGRRVRTGRAAVMTWRRPVIQSIPARQDWSSGGPLGPIIHE